MGPARLAATGGECYTPGAAGLLGARRAAGRGTAPFLLEGTKCPPTTTVATGASAPSRCGSGSRKQPLTTCDRCGGPIRRLLSAAPFILKGGGWYVTDYPSAGRKKGMESEKKSSDLGLTLDDDRDDAASTTTVLESELESELLELEATARRRSRLRRRPADAGARPDPEPAARAPLTHEHLDPARAVDHRPERPSGPLGVGPDQPAHAGAADPQDTAVGRARQIRSQETRQQVPEAVDQEHLAVDSRTAPARRRTTAAAPGRGAAGPNAASRTPREQWAATGANTSRPWNVRLTGCRWYRAGGQHDPASAGQVEAEPEEPVVGPDEVVAAGRHGDRPARAARPPDPRPPGAPSRGGKNCHAPSRSSEARRTSCGRHRVGQVDEPGAGIDAEQDSLDHADVRVIETEVGEQRDDAARARRPPPAHRSRWITYSAIRVRIWRAGESGNRPSAAMPASA